MPRIFRDHAVATFLICRPVEATNGACCAGTILIDLSGIEPVLSPLTADHRSFIDNFVPLAMCTKTLTRT